MRTFRPDPRDVDRFGTHGVSMAAVVFTGASDVVSVNLATVAPGGEIGRHESVGWQVFCVIEGSGWVTGPDGMPVAIAAGTAAVWEPGELHASGSTDGMLVCVVETSAEPRQPRH